MNEAIPATSQAIAYLARLQNIVLELKASNAPIPGSIADAVAVAKRLATTPSATADDYENLRTILRSIEAQTGKSAVNANISDIVAAIGSTNGDRLAAGAFAEWATVPQIIGGKVVGVVVGALRIDGHAAEDLGIGKDTMDPPDLAANVAVAPADPREGHAEDGMTLPAPPKAPVEGGTVEGGTTAPPAAAEKPASTLGPTPVIS